MAPINYSTLEKLMGSIETGKDDRDKLGHVRTPTHIVDEILNNMPPQLFEDPNLKWCDVGAGLGNLSVGVYLRLIKNKKMKQLFPDKKKRKAHILNNMLYLVEINDSFCKNLKKMFATSSIIQKDFLTEDITKDIGGQPDVIISNPPYSVTVNGKKGRNGVIVWYKFVERSFQIVKKNGYLAFITPPVWRNPLNKISENIIHRHLLTLRMITVRDSRKFFEGSRMKVDWYIMKNTVKPTRKPKIFFINDDHQTGTIVNVRKNNGTDHPFPMYPNFGWNLCTKLYALSQKYGNLKVILVSTHHKSTKKIYSEKKNVADGYIYPIVTKLNRHGLEIKYSNKKHKYIGTPKIIISASESNYPYYDEKGELGTSHVQYLIPLMAESKKQRDQDAQKIIDFLNSDIIRFYLEALRMVIFMTSNLTFAYVPDPLQVPNPIMDYLSKEDLQEVKDTLSTFSKYRN